MRLAIFLLLALCAVCHSNEINCEVQRKCSTDFYPICAGNERIQKTYTNNCIFDNDYCRCHLCRLNFKVIDSTKACTEDSKDKVPCFSD